MALKRHLYSATLSDFLGADAESILGRLTKASAFSIEQPQRDAWLEEIRILKKILTPYSGAIFFEYAIPRMGRRIDVVLIIQHVIFVLEFKVGERGFPSHAIDQVWDYALDLKNFHTSSHAALIAPVLIATNAPDKCFALEESPHKDQVLLPMRSNSEQLGNLIASVLQQTQGPTIDPDRWDAGNYSPTPTIVEAAMALYNGHSVNEISRSDASAINLRETSSAISEIIVHSRDNHRKSICFVTGVPGAGKTLVGLNIATQHTDKNNDLYSVFLSGNGPLVAILREALARDKVRHEREHGRRIKKGKALSDVKMFIQNVHHFRDECLIDQSKPPIEHVVLFDEAQRAWNKEQTAAFMRRKKGIADFTCSEPEFLISCLDRHQHWAVIVCLVGGGQEINTGEAGIGEWLDALCRRFPNWDVYISSQLHDSEYASGEAIQTLQKKTQVSYKNALHLAVSMRSFRAEHLSTLIKQLLDLEKTKARETYAALREKYPIVLTRDVAKARSWLRQQARGSERYGIVVSSQAERLKPHAIDVKSPVNPIHWFLHDKDDIRSSYYLEDVATEFHVQGLELDWTCVAWDGDLRFQRTAWQHWSFRGNRWERIQKPERQRYLKNAYRVLLTRARQGMVIVVPQGTPEDPTRAPEFYDATFEYLQSIGFQEI
jgi:hypothetical protein